MKPTKLVLKWYRQQKLKKLPSWAKEFGDFDKISIDRVIMSQNGIRPDRLWQSNFNNLIGRIAKREGKWLTQNEDWTLRGKLEDYSKCYRSASNSKKVEAYAKRLLRRLNKNR